MDDATYVLKISPSDYELLRRLANVLDVSMSDLSHRLVNDGMLRLQSPSDIECELAAQRDRLRRGIATLKDDL
ncbi:hypothetical protein ACWDTI_21485 [Gordonia sp. NPDC003424]